MYKISINYLSIYFALLLIIAVISNSIFMYAIALIAIGTLLLRVKTSSIELKEDRITYRVGILNRIETSILYSKINNIQMSSNIIQSQMNVSNILIYTGNDQPLMISSVANGRQLKEELDLKITIKS